MTIYTYSPFSFIIVSGGVGDRVYSYSGKIYIPNTTCRIGPYYIGYLEANTLVWDISSLDAKYVVRSGDGSAIIRSSWSGKHAIAISGSGLEPPPFKTDSFSEVIPVVLQKQSFPPYSGNIIVTRVTISTSPNEAEWSWSIEGEEV
jgi:hypothetical protein